MEHPIVMLYLKRQFSLHGLKYLISDFFIYLVFLVLLNIYALSVPPKAYFEDNKGNISYTCLNSDAKNTTPDLKLYEELLHFQQFSYYNTTYQQHFKDNCETSYIMHSNKYIIIKCLLLFVTAVRMFTELFSIFKRTFGLYFKDYMNSVEWFLYGLTIYYLCHNGVFVERNNSEYYYSENTAHVCGSIAVFLSWINLLLFIKNVPKIGIYVMMLEHCFVTFMEFSIILVIFLSAFGITFNLLMGNKIPYQNWYVSILSILVIMTGEQEYQAIVLGDHPQEHDATDLNWENTNDMAFTNELLFPRAVCYIIHTLCLIFMSILVMNLMIGLAVSDIDQINEVAQQQQLSVYIEENIVDNLYSSWILSNKIGRWFTSDKYRQKLSRINHDEQTIRLNYNFEVIKKKEKGKRGNSKNFLSKILCLTKIERKLKKIFSREVDFTLLKQVAYNPKWCGRKSQVSEEEKLLNKQDKTLNKQLNKMVKDIKDIKQHQELNFQIEDDNEASWHIDYSNRRNSIIVNPVNEVSPGRSSRKTMKAKVDQLTNEVANLKKGNEEILSTLKVLIERMPK